MFRRRELDAPDAFEEAARHSYERLAATFAKKNDLEVQAALQGVAAADAAPGFLYGVLVDKDNSDKVFRHLVNCTLDGYAAFSGVLQELCHRKFPVLVPHCSKRLFRLVDDMLKMDVDACEPILTALLGQIASGSSSARNVSVAASVLAVVKSNQSYVQQRTAVLQRFLYTFIRVLPDLDAKLQAECVPFLSGLLAATPGELHAIGRDVARVLQPSIAQHASLKAIFESLPVSVYQRQTSSDMLQSRLTPDMEVKISFILNQVPLGVQQRYVSWFAMKFVKGSETLLLDLIRYLCCAVQRPPASSPASKAVPPWVLLGWCIKTHMHSPIAPQLCRAALYDWLFFNNETSVQRIECALLLMMNSTTRYTEIAQVLLDTLLDCAQKWNPSSMRSQIRSSIDAAFVQGSANAGIASLSSLMLTPQLRASLPSMFPQAFGATSGAPPNLKRAASSPPLSGSPPTKLARVPSTEPTQSLLARVLRRLPVSLKEPFSTLFVSLHGDGAGQSKLSAVPLATNAANAILLFSSTAESNNDALKQICASFVELLSTEFCKGEFHASILLAAVFDATRGSPTLLALMRTAEPQLGFHLLDWVERHPEQADLYSAALANAQQTIDADIAVCRATCPVHTSILVRRSYELFPSLAVSNPALFSLLVRSTPPHDIVELADHVSQGAVLLVKNDGEKVSRAVDMAMSSSFTSTEQLLSWMLLSAQIHHWPDDDIVLLVERVATRSDCGPSHQQALASLLRGVAPSLPTISVIARLPDSTASLKRRVLLSWFHSHREACLASLTAMATSSASDLPAIVDAIGTALEHPPIADTFLLHVRSSETLTKALSSIDNEIVRGFLKGSAPIQLSTVSFATAESSQTAESSPTVESTAEFDHIDMDGWASFATST
ncbi:Integrator complex subunit 3 N-terminal domain-containing protein [Plasmodiophora brassicae]